MYITIALLLCGLTVTIASSVKLMERYDNKSITNLIGPLVYNIAERYFLSGHCICVITEGNSDILKYIPKAISVFHIQIGGTGSTIQEIEDSDTFDARKLTNDTQNFERLLIDTMRAGCEPYVIQVRNMRSVIHSFARTTRRAETRYCKRFLLLPVSLEHNLLHLEGFFSMPEMNYLTGLIVARLQRSPVIGNEALNLEHKNSKDFNLITYQGQKSSPYYVKESKNLDYMCRQKNDSIDPNVTVIELITPKFVGKKPSAEVALDLWISKNEENGFFLCADLYPDKMVDLEGREIAAVTIHYLPFIVLIHDDVSPIYDGMEFLTFFEFQKKLNFTWKLVLDEENFWGAVWPNGSGNGVVGLVAEDRVDIGFAAMYSWFTTYQWTDYTVAYCSSGITCLAPKPKTLPRWLALWLPFSPVMWGAVVLSLFCITVVFYVLGRASHRYLGTVHVVSYATVINCLLTTLGMFVLQPPPDPEGTGRRPTKWFVAILLVFFLLVSSVYSGGLASVLTVPRYEDPIDTPRQLADSNLPWVNVHEAWVWSLLDSDDELSKTLVKHFKVLTEEEMTIMSTQGKTAFPLEKMSGGSYSVPAHVNETAVRTLRIMKEMLYGSHVIMLTRKTSPYMARLNLLISSIYETGIMSYWEGQTIRRYMSERLQIAIRQSVILGDSDDGPKQLMTEHLQGAFIILLLGLSLATVAFVAEVMGGAFNHRHKKQDHKMATRSEPATRNL